MKIEDLKNMPLQYCKGVGEARANAFAKLKIFTAYDLLFHFPRTYEDWAKPYKIIDAPVNEICAIKGFVSSPVKENRIRRGMTVYKALIRDETADMTVTLFNCPYTAALLHENEEYIFYGKPEGSMFHKSLSSPKFMLAQNAPPIVPLYPLTAGLTQNIVKKIVLSLLEKICDDLSDPIPEKIRKEYNLCHISFAVKNIHEPQSEEALLLARNRLVFEELFCLRLGMSLLKNRGGKPSEYPIKSTDITEFADSLPYSLTNAQLRTIKEAARDMASGKAMNRLLQGDVGSGKTAVAAAIMYLCQKSGYQSAMMAPTEILATQHFSTLSKMLKPLNINVALLTGSTSASKKKEILNSLKSGETDILIGTHAVIEHNVEFNNLALVITDEQHRFGVNQRGELSKKGENPHTLVMSATPIPRTLAFMIYGDLDLSILDEMPQGRKPVKTYFVDSSYKTRLLNFIKKQVEAGHQVYTVCPLVSEKENDLTSAEQYYEEISQTFPQYKVGLLHGKLKAKEKAQVMDSFNKNETQILVATTVIEVGVDVPNATLMLIENAERFGLSQLHQLRGRVGRGDAESYCVLVSDAQNELTVNRLKTMATVSDGFMIAQKDLEIRGPGDFFGERQHGLPLLQIADLFTDMDMLKTASKAADNLLKEDFSLSLPENIELKKRIDTLFESAYNS